MALAKFISKIVTSITKVTFQFNKTLDVLISQFKDGCPTTPELALLIDQKNLINGALVQIEQKIATLNKVAEGSSAATDALSKGKTIIKQLPAPSAVPPGVGLPLNIFNNFSDALDNLGTLIYKSQASLDTIPDALDLIKKDVGEVITKLKEFDAALNKCLEEDSSITQDDSGNFVIGGVTLTLDATTDNFVGVLTEKDLEDLLSKPPGLLYGDYYLRLRELPSDFSFIKKQIIAQNKESVLPPGEYYKEGAPIEKLQGDKSFSSSTSVLVDEMKWLIDTKDLIFPPTPPAEDPLKAIYKAGQIVILMSIYGANQEEADELYEMAWELSQGKGPNKGYFNTLVEDAFNNSRTLLEQAVANEGYEWKEGDRVLDSTIKNLFLGGVTDEDKIKTYISLLRRMGKSLEDAANSLGGAFNPTGKSWANENDFYNKAKLESYATRLYTTAENNYDNLGSFESLRPEMKKRKRLMQAIFEEANYLSLQNAEISFNDPLSEYFSNKGVGYNTPIINGQPIIGTSDSPITFDEVESLWNATGNGEIDLQTEWFIYNVVPGSSPDEAIFEGKPVIYTFLNGDEGNFLAFAKTQLMKKLREALGIEWYNANALTTSELAFWGLNPAVNPNSTAARANDPNKNLDSNDPWYFEFGKNGLPIPTGL